ncbi:molybdopterin dinucleotide binding domain-containing protein [Thiohalobacter thiocyanaticus]|uniref:molybdopterin dinucleotide binding domain-containing protein n=1 Tax=Thiohalobacter thiocyanaticus TaxID=585455 RepID=UPI001319EBC3|nr:molybdopterin dinucleotide binding domain-containing protein [Thiohalobacter thiocyanaticus]
MHPVNASDPEYPLVLNSGRVRDHWHTMTRTAKSPRLSRHTLEPCLEVHPADAMAYGIPDEGLAKVTSRWGEAVLRVRVSRDQRQGSVFAPIHWNGRHSSLPTVDVLINPETDPVSGQPEFKHTPVRIEDWRPQWFGFILTRNVLEMEAAGYWCRARIAEGLWRYEIAGRPGQGWEALVTPLRAATGDGEWVEFSDPAAGRYRAARLADGCLDLCLFIGPDTALPARDWLGELFDRPVLDATDRGTLLSGAPAGAVEAAGRTVCACFGVGPAHAGGGHS